VHKALQYCAQHRDEMFKPHTLVKAQDVKG
jgi:hypothetical protein